jgi:hypothetical protein
LICSASMRSTLSSRPFQDRALGKKTSQWMSAAAQ